MTFPTRLPGTSEPRNTPAPEPLSLPCSQDLLQEPPAASVGAEHPPPVSIWEHLQMHLSLSMSLVLKSLPGWLMLLSLPAVPDRPFRWILRAGRGDTEACRGARGGQCRKPPSTSGKGMSSGQCVATWCKQEQAYHQPLTQMNAPRKAAGASQPRGTFLPPPDKQWGTRDGGWVRPGRD